MTGNSLDDFLEASRQGASGPCGYVRNTTPEQREQIRVRVEQNIRKWAAYSRWLKAEGSPVTEVMVQYHFANGHDDER